MRDLQEGGEQSPLSAKNEGCTWGRILSRRTLICLSASARPAVAELPASAVWGSIAKSRGCQMGSWHRC